MTRDQLIDRVRRLEDENEDLRCQEDLYRSLLDNSLDCILLAIPTGEIVAANTAAQRIPGRAEEEICRWGHARVAVLWMSTLQRHWKNEGGPAGEWAYIHS
jgi:PAS domain-containing protein